jgi:AraC-like DNA-binding protein
MDVAIYPIINSEFGLPFVVHGVGSQTSQPHFIREEGYPVHQIIFCTSGEGKVFLEGEVYHIKKDDYFYIKPNVPHEYYGITDCWGTDWITFDGDGVVSTMEKLNLCTAIGRISKNKKRIHIAFNKIYTALKSNVPFSGFVSSGAVYDLFIELYIAKCSELEENNLQTNFQIEKVIEYMDKHYQEPITLEELAQLVEITPQHLCKIFKKTLNIRPFEYLSKKRIQEAKKLLGTSNLSIKDIGKAVGFNDKSYFYLMFKRYEMVSPSEFRGSYKRK